MIKLLFSLVGAVAMMLVACGEYGFNPNARYYLSKAWLRVAEREALEGDNAAAKRLGDYYYFVKNDRADWVWWYKLAAIRGDLVAKQTLARLQHEQP